MTMLWRKHWPLFVLLAVAVVVGSLPYLIGLVMRPSGYSLVGVSPLAAGDATVYYSYIEQGRHGSWFMHDVFTAEHSSATIWQPLWFLIGQAANLFQVSTPWAYALARILATPLLVLALWWFTGWLWTDRRPRLTASFVAILGAGLGGWLWVLWPHWVGHFGYGAIDQWVSEAFLNLTLLGSPHFILVTAGILVALVSVERSWEDRSWTRMKWACLAAFGVVAIHPFHIVTWALIAFGMILVHWRSAHRLPHGYIARWLVLGITILPVVMLYGLQLTFDPLTISRAAQNVLRTPSPLRTILGLGALLPLGLWGIWKFARQNRRWAFVSVWAVATILAMYTPVSFQRRLSQGLIIPWAILSIPVLMMWWERARRHGVLAAMSLIIGVAILLGSTWPSVLVRFMQSYQGQLDGRPGHTYFLSPDQQQSIAFLRTSNAILPPILASLHDSNIIAGLTARTVFVGHEVETIDYRTKADVLDRFYHTSSDEERRAILSYYHICTIIDGPQERAIGSTFVPSTWPDLEPIWTSPSVTIYRAQQCE